MRYHLSKMPDSQGFYCSRELSDMKSWGTIFLLLRLSPVRHFVYNLWHISCLRPLIKKFDRSWEIRKVFMLIFRAPLHHANQQLNYFINRKKIKIWLFFLGNYVLFLRGAYQALVLGWGVGAMGHPADTSGTIFHIIIQPQYWNRNSHNILMIFHSQIFWI